MQQVAGNVWTLQYPLPVLGTHLGRTVTVVRLQSGKLVIHSTAPFAPSDIAAIRELGEPGWLLDATLFHDSFAKEGRRAFPDIPYLAPSGFQAVAGVETSNLTPAPPEWAGQLEVVPLPGMPKVREHVFFHRPSRTLIVCDFFFNMGGATSSWTRFFTRYVMRLRHGVGMSFFFRVMLRDRDAFREGARRICEWDFERIIVGHGEPIAREAKEVFQRELQARDLAPR